MMASNRENSRNGAQPLKLQLNRSGFTAGQQVSGVVILRLAKPTSLQSVSVSITGLETPMGAGLSRSLRRRTTFFQRELLLSGMEQPLRTSERVSQFWNALLARDCGRILSAGEHIYPFSIPIPASLPPSYDGKAGKIAYTITARVLYPIGKSRRIATDAQVASKPRSRRDRPVALSYPNANGTVQSTDMTVNLELPCRDAEIGGSLDGRLSIRNPQHTPIEQISVVLEQCEWVHPSRTRELQRKLVDSMVVKPDDRAAEAIEMDICLNIPADSLPTVQGVAISVVWLLKLNIDTTPPVELRTPIIVYLPASE